MPTFHTPEPISVTVELGVGNLRIVASDRTDTMVEVRPSDAAKKADVTAAEQTRVEYAGGRLLIKAPKSWRQLTWRGGGESIDVQVELRLRGRDPEFVVTPPPADSSADDLAEDPDDRPPAFPEGDEGTMSRINLRMPDHLKARIEQAAASEGLSVNAWLVRAAAAALERNGPPRRREPRASKGAQRYTGWAR